MKYELAESTPPEIICTSSHAKMHNGRLVKVIKSVTRNNPVFANGNLLLITHYPSKSGNGVFDAGVMSLTSGQVYSLGVVDRREAKLRLLPKGTSIKLTT